MNCRSIEMKTDSALIGGHYRLGELLGQGGVARVYSATDILSNQPVALKMALENDPLAVDAVRSEFRFAMTHRHPSLINPINILDDENRTVIVMPYVNGFSQCDLKAIMDSAVRRGDEWIDNFIVELFECAAFIHYCGYLYNDYKPSNFIWKSDSKQGNQVQPLLLDFNLVSQLGEHLARRGTIEYAAPEVLLGETPAFASDFYSIGATLYELFAGAPPYSSDDSAELIRQITENGPLDLSPIPLRFRDGLAALLMRDAKGRPQNGLAAAAAFGLEQRFTELTNSRANYYLSAGNPPFFEELKKTVTEYLAGKSEKALSISGSGWGTGEFDYLTAEFGLRGYHIERIKYDYHPAWVSSAFDYLLNQTEASICQKTILLIDNYSSLQPDSLAGLRALLRHPRQYPIIFYGDCWKPCELPRQPGNPLRDRTAQNATADTLIAFLKKNQSVSNMEALSLATGGNPELVRMHILSSIETGLLDLASTERTTNISVEITPEIEAILERCICVLNEDQTEIYSTLAAWDGDIPLILLAEFSDSQRKLIDYFLASAHLYRGKDSIAFPSDDFRQIIYRKTPEKKRQCNHRFWAEAVENYIAEDDGRLELLALHWGRSDNPQKGYQANIEAARELFKKSDFAKANLYSETLLTIARNGGGPLSDALMLAGDIAKQAGDYINARKRYLELLLNLDKNQNAELRAETFKDLGDLNRSIKKPGRALYYTQKALILFNKLNNRQGMANCHNNIGLICWVKEEYEKALDSFSSAFELNQSLGNFQEQVKIQSNMGIVKDIMGRTSEVAGHFEKALIFAQRAGDYWLEALTANNLGYFYINQNELDKAQIYLSQALEISSKIGYTENVINTLSNLGLCNLRAGALFSAIDYCQQAIQMAETINNKHQASEAQLFLSEVGILMGNFSLADKVLKSLEGDRIYAENKLFAKQVDLLRSWWYRVVGDTQSARNLAESIADYAKSVGNQRLESEANLSFLLALSIDDCVNPLSDLRELAPKALNLGHNDIAESANLASAKAYLAQGNPLSAEPLIDDIYSRPGQSRKVALEARLLLGNLKSIQKNYDQAIKLFSEAEIQAAGDGFLPDALDGAIGLAEIFFECGKSSRGQETLRRAFSYADRIVGSLPDEVSRQAFSRLPAISRLEALRNQTEECLSI